MNLKLVRQDTKGSQPVYLLTEVVYTSSSVWKTVTGQSRTYKKILKGIKEKQND